MIYRKVHGSQLHSCLSPLWPKTLGRLLDLIEFSMTEDSSPSLIPCGNLNESQVILLRWGEVVPWTWVMWRDGRLWNSEQIRFLVVVRIFIHRSITEFTVDLDVVFSCGYFSHRNHTQQVGKK